MKLIALFFIFTIILNASNFKPEMIQLFKENKYQKLCKLGFKNFAAIRDDEQTLTLYAFGCLYADKVDNLAVPIILLKNSKEARANAAYFSTILMQKKLLFHSLYDNYPLKNINLPTTDYLLSKVFDLYLYSPQQLKKDTYILKDKKNQKVTYKLYLFEKKIVIEEYYDTILIRKHIY